jgi:hypothetical protein
VETIWVCARNDFSGKGLKFLLRKGGIRRCNDRHKVNVSTPISVCCSRGNLKGLKAMIDVAEEVGFALDAGIATIGGAEPMNYAVQSRGNNHATGSVEDFCEIIKLMVTKLGRNLEEIVIVPTKPPVTALARSCELREKRLVETCLELGADVNRPSLHNGGMTPLHFAVKSASTSITQLLLDHGADTRALVDGVYLPIVYSMETMSFACADLILRHEADLEAQGKKLPPLSQELALYNNISIIMEGVENFRKTGNPRMDYMADRVLDIRSDPQSRIYSEQATARVASKNYGSNKCDGCGAYGVKLKACSRCKTAMYCGQPCQKAHWKQHKAICKAASK